MTTLDRLRDAYVEVLLDSLGLRLRGGGGVLTADLLADARAHRAELFEALLAEHHPTPTPPQGVGRCADCGAPCGTAARCAGCAAARVRARGDAA